MQGSTPKEDATATRALKTVDTPSLAGDPGIADVASKYGRKDELGNIFLVCEGTERLIGQWTLGEEAGDPLVFYAKRFLDIKTELRLVDVRLKEGSVNAVSAQTTIARIRKNCETPNFIGDIEDLRSQLDSLEQLINQAAVKEQEKKAAERAATQAVKEALAERAEKISTSTQWKATSEEFVEIVTKWKALPRVGKSAETALWKRISKSRSNFEKNRRTHFAKRKKEASQAQETKSALIRQAEELATSTDWEKSGKTMNQLMQQWKTSPRADRKTEEKLWGQFSTARDTFFAARRAHEAKLEEAARAKLPEALNLMTRIEAAATNTDLRAARRGVIELLDDFDKLGTLPKSDEKEFGKKIKAVQDDLRNREQAERRRIDPEKSGRASSTAEQLKQRMQAVSAQLESARQNGDSKKVAELEAQLAMQQSLLGAAEAVLQEFAQPSHA